MKPVLTIVTAAAFAVLALACGAGNGVPDQPLQQGSPQAAQPAPPAGPPLVDVTGTWKGTGTDSNANTGANGTPFGTTVVTLAMTQTGASVSGTVTTQSTDLPGTCASCHRTRTGTLSGTVAGTTLTWTLSFPADAANDPTPACTATFSGTTSEITQDSLSALYSGQDLCEGLYTSGALTAARAP